MTPFSAAATKTDLDLKSIILETAAAAPKSPRTHKVSETGNSGGGGGGAGGDGDEAAGAEGGKRRTVVSENGDCSSSSSSSNGGVNNDDDDNHRRTVTALLEMFPYSCSLEVNHCLHLAAGDVETAAQIIMHRHEAGQSLKPLDRKVWIDLFCSDQQVFIMFFFPSCLRPPGRATTRP